MQYLASKSIIKINWSQLGTKYEKAFHERIAEGSSGPPTVLSLWNWLVDFLLADFPPRATFIAGFTLGLRLG